MKMWKVDNEAEKSKTFRSSEFQLVAAIEKLNKQNINLKSENNNADFAGATLDRGILMHPF